MYVDDALIIGAHLDELGFINVVIIKLVLGEVFLHQFVEVFSYIIQ